MSHSNYNSPLPVKKFDSLSCYNSPVPVRKSYGESASCYSSPARTLKFSCHNSPARSLAGNDSENDSDATDLPVEIPSTADSDLSLIDGWMKFRDKRVSRYKRPIYFSMGPKTSTRMIIFYARRQKISSNKSYHSLLNLSS